MAYWLYYREHFGQAGGDFAADAKATLSLLARTASKEPIRKPAPLAAIRANGGWFGAAHRARDVPRDAALLDEVDFAEWVAAFRSTGFYGANAW